MYYPVVTIQSISTNRISNNSGANITTVVFSFDEDILEYSVDVNGNSFASGVLADQGYGVVDLAVITCIPAGTTITAYVDSTEMYSEGINRVNIYGKGLDGVWTPYNT